MSNPTATFSWQYPSENQDPWFSQFDTFASAIDLQVASAQTRVTSLEQAMLPRITQVLSVYPSGTGPTIQGSTTPTAWTIMSAAPYGRFVGSFSVLNSGVVVAFTWYPSMFFGGAGAFMAAAAKVQWRGVVLPGSITVPNSDGSQGWNWPATTNGNHLPQAFFGVTSLGPGNFSIEMQGRLVTFANAESRWSWDANDQFTLFTTTGLKGT